MILLSEQLEYTNPTIEELSSIEFIFQNGGQVLDGAYPPTIYALAKCMGIDKKINKNGNYFLNAMKILEAAKPFLKNNDLDGYLYFCK